jgi:hypothetical protein
LESGGTVIKEWKYGTPVWSHDGTICTGKSYKDKVKLTVAEGASLQETVINFVCREYHVSN